MTTKYRMISSRLKCLIKIRSPLMILLVHVSLVPVNLPANNSHVISGWFPIFDTLHGIRGEIKVIVKVRYFSDTKQSSCGIRFFYADKISPLFKLVEVIGFVEELVIEDDPEYKWIDKIRTSRASNEARQLLFMRLAATLQRKIGAKVVDLGGNAVMGYRQCFDLEGSFGVVVRAIGTCVIIKEAPASTDCSPVGIDKNLDFSISTDSSPEKAIIHRRLSRTKNLSCNSDAASEMMSLLVGPSSPSSTFPIVPSKPNSTSTDFPFYTVGYYPPGFVVNVSGIVTSRSVKLLDKLESMPEESDSRDKLWLELRKEIRAHMKTLECNAVIGYSEQSTICDKLCVLSATGTAVVVSPHALSVTPDTASSPDLPPCHVCHIPYNVHTSPFSLPPQLCNVCGQGDVPEILLTTIGVIPGVPINGHGSFIHAQSFRLRKKLTGEHSAHSIGQQLPFLEYEIHSQLTQKLRILGMNAIVGIRYELCVGETAVCCIASGTAVYLAPLPTPSVVQVECPTGSSSKVELLQDAIKDAYERSMTQHGISPRSQDETEPLSPWKLDTTPETDASSKPDFNLTFSTKEVVVVDIEDPKDEVKIKNYLESPFPPEIYTSNLSTIPGLTKDASLDTCERSRIITQIFRIIIPSSDSPNNTVNLDEILRRNIQLLSFKMRKHRDCYITNIRFNVHMPDDDEIIVVLLCCANINLTPERRYRSSLYPRKNFQRSGSSGDGAEELSLTESNPDNDAKSITITPSEHLPGTIIKQHLGHVNLFLIRESSDVRDLSSFIKTFFMEAQAVVRAHVAAVGGNVLFMYRIRELVLTDGPQKMQAQILLNVLGDAAEVVFPV